MTIARGLQQRWGEKHPLEGQVPKSFGPPRFPPDAPSHRAAMGTNPVRARLPAHPHSRGNPPMPPAPCRHWGTGARDPSGWAAIEVWAVPEARPQKQQPKTNQPRNIFIAPKVGRALS